MALLMPRMNEMRNTGSFSPNLLSTPHTIPNVFCILSTVSGEFKTVSHNTFVGMTDIPFVGVRWQKLVKFLCALMIPLQHLGL